MWMKTWSIRKPRFHALLARRSMRANRKPSVKVVNLSCKFSNSSVASIDQQPWEPPEHKSPSFFARRGKENPDERKIICGVSKKPARKNMVFYHMLVLFMWDAFFTHIWGWPAQLGHLWETPKRNEQHSSTKRKHGAVRDQYYWRFPAKRSLWSAWQAGLKWEPRSPLSPHYTHLSDHQRISVAVTHT